jgi:hypothetical protein
MKLRRPKGLSWKYTARILLVPGIARIGAALGAPWKTLGRRLGRESLIAQLSAAGPPELTLPAPMPLNIVLLTMMGGNNRIASVEVVLGRALMARGHRVRYVLCDQALPACEVKAADSEHRWRPLCAKCYAFGQRYLSATGAEILPVSELIADQRDEGEWREYVESALLKHYRVGVLHESRQVQDRRELFRQAAQITARVGRKLVELKPDRIVMSHGIYCTWGPAREILNQAGIPVMTYGDGKKRHTQNFNWTCSADWWDVSAEWSRVRETALTPAQDAVIDEYLRSRRNHSRDARVYNFGPEQTAEQTRRQLRLDPNKPTFVLFTNVLWDAASAQREIAFANPIEWVMETISWFAQHPDRQLVVKIHPAEVVIGTKQPFAAVITRRFPQLPSNVRVIEPHEKANSWSIAQVADLGLVHTSTVGMELPLERVPCAVVSRTHFRDRGFTIDVNSKDQYFDLLAAYQRPSKAQREGMRTLARRYAYLLFERYQLPFPFLIDSDDPGDVRALESIEPAELLHHPSMKVILEGIENLGSLVLPADVI